MTWSILTKSQSDDSPFQDSLKLLATAQSLDGIDPHLIWADLTYFNNLYAQIVAPNPFEPWKEKLDVRPISVIFEKKEDVTPLCAVLGDPTIVSNLKFGAGFVKASKLVKFSETVKRFRVGMTEGPLTDNFDSPSRAPYLIQPDDQDKDKVVFGFIDHGFAFANKKFLKRTGNTQQSRIEILWDQQYGYPATYTLNPSWVSVPQFGYGRELSGAVITNLIHTRSDENEIYIKTAYEPAQRARAHATHVVCIATGAMKIIASDAASNAPIIAVQLPAKTFKDTSGQNLCVQVLNAVHYILAHAQGRKVVINISDGAYAGPHDGSSLLESALDELLVTYKDKLEIVVAAGNQFDERIHWQETFNSDKPSNLNWRVLPDDKTDSYCEVWFDNDLTAEVAKKITVTVISPSGDQVSLQLGQTAMQTAGRSPQIKAAVTFALNPPNGLDRKMILVAVTSTISKKNHHLNRGTTLEHGVWQIKLESTSKVDINFNAYIERDNPALGDRGPRRQSFFIHPDFPRSKRTAHAAIDDTGNSSPIKRMGALNNLATAEHVIVAGGYVKKTQQMAAYSASGTGRKVTPPGIQGVDIIAPCDISSTIRGIRGSGVRTSSSFRMDGTSVAAPQVARTVLNNLQAGHGALHGIGHIGVPVLTEGPKERVGTLKI